MHSGKSFDCVIFESNLNCRFQSFIGTLGDINATDVGSRFGKHCDYQRLLGCANASMPGALVNLFLLLLATATARLAMIILCGAAWLHKQNMVFQQNVLH